jgi:hypothetical protein
MLLGRGRTTSVVALALFALSCGGDSPSTPNTTPTPPVATPPPPAGGGTGSLSCPLGAGTNAFSCDRKNSRLLARVESAMNLLVQQRPQLFDLQDEAGPATRAYKVLDETAYFNGLVANLVAQGLCAERDVDDPYQQTILVKDGNEFSEEFDVILSTGHMRRGIGAYRTTCAPAAFPVQRSADAPPVGSGCYRPYPPPVSSMNCKVHLKGNEYYTLDSTPIVGPDVQYCAAAGFTDGRAHCSIRPEGAVDREACENWRVGRAKDTGRPGPTWRKADGTFCTGPASGCANSASTQYQLWSYVGGTYTVSAENGVGCTVVVER